MHKLLIDQMIRNTYCSVGAILVVDYNSGRMVLQTLYVFNESLKARQI